MSTPVVLFHGTSEAFLASILRNGIRPRGREHSTKWKVPSNPKAVYLTNAYPLHFAGHAVKGSSRLAVIEVAMDRLYPWDLAPDEDMLEQATRKNPEFAHVHDRWPGPAGMVQRTLWFRSRVMEYQSHWQLSLKALGTLCHYGIVPPEAISRVALLPAGGEWGWASDPTITILNYRLMGGYYRQLSRRLFGDPVVAEDLPDYGQNWPAPYRSYLERLEELSRDHIEVRGVNPG